MTYCVSSLYLITVSIVCYVWIVFCNFFFKNSSNNFCTSKITNNLSTAQYFQISWQKNFWSIWNITFFKNVFVLDILTWSPTWNLASSSFFFLYWMKFLNFTSTGFILIVLWYILLCLLTISSNLSTHSFWYCSHVLVNFTF